MTTNTATLNCEADVKARLAVIDAHDGALKAVAQRMDAIALADARRCDTLADADANLGLLHGMPFAVKDIIDVAGIPTRSGSLTRSEHPPAAVDAPVVAALRAHGAIPIVKTNTVEFAIGGWGTNETVGTPHNPWDKKTPRVPGGSSSGTGVLVGGGLLPGGLGTDTGGSVRIPASFCGCVGLKTSTGLISRAGVTPLSESLDTVGPLAQTVTLAAHMFYAMLGPETEASSDVQRCRDRTLRELNRGNHGLRLGVVPFESMPSLADDVRVSFEKSLTMLEESGATLAPCDLPIPLTDYQHLGGLISATEAYATYQSIVDDSLSPMAKPNRTRMSAGADVPAYELVRVHRQRQLAIAEFESVFDRFDAIVLPTTPTTAIPIDDVDETDMTMSAHTRLANYLQLSALAVPIDLTAEGLPTSLQIVTRQFDDPLALRIGRGFESVRGAFPLPKLDL